MTTAPDTATPCWTIALDFDAEYLEHYSTEDKANLALAYRLNDLFNDDPPDTFEGVDLDVHQGSAPCVRLVCDGCGQAADYEGEPVDPEHGDHFELTDLDAFLIDALGWTIADGHDYCPTCPTEPDPSVAEDMARKPGPNDVPFDGLGVPTP